VKVPKGKPGIVIEAVKTKLTGKEKLGETNDNIYRKICLQVYLRTCQLFTCLAEGNNVFTKSKLSFCQ